MAPADDDHWMARRRAVEVVAVGKPLLRELALVPVAVGDDDLALGSLRRAGGDGVENVLKAPGA